MDEFIGQRIKKIRPATRAEYETIFEQNTNENLMTIVLENGTKILTYAEENEEGDEICIGLNKEGEPVEIGETE